MRRHSAAVAAVTVAAILTATGAATAKVPRFGPKTIVPGQSIGGVKVGMTGARAKVLWGTPDRCTADRPGVTWCQYLAVSHIGTSRLLQPFAGFYIRHGRVVAVGLESAENTAVDRKVHQVRSRKGIRVGSSTPAVKHAYRIGPAGRGEAGLSRYILKGRPNRCTLFYAPTSPYKTVEAIQVGICNAAGLV